VPEGADADDEDVRAQPAPRERLVQGADRSDRVLVRDGSSEVSAAAAVGDGADVHVRAAERLEHSAGETGRDIREGPDRRDDRGASLGDHAEDVPSFDLALERGGQQPARALGIGLAHRQAEATLGRRLRGHHHLHAAICQRFERERGQGRYAQSAPSLDTQERRAANRGHRPDPVAAAIERDACPRMFGVERIA
jgi:hypothetical protein